MKTMNDVIAFIKKAMDKKCIITLFNRFEGRLEIQIKTDPSVYKTIDFELVDNSLSVWTVYGSFNIDNLTNKEVAQFKVLEAECIEYNIQRGIESFNSFFTELDNN